MDKKTRFQLIENKNYNPNKKKDSTRLERPPALEDYLSDRDRGFCVRMIGDAMMDAGICSNDLIVANADEPLESGSIVVAILNGEMLIRRYFKSDDGSYLMPENVNYPSIDLSSKEYDICGVVTKIIHSI